ncbi:MAG: protein translocase subunit SecD [bacterium]|nr:protein translocase subunit SecD [bacterium]
MNRKLRWRIFTIFCVLLLCVYYLYPTARWAGLAPGERARLEEEWLRRDAEVMDEGPAARLLHAAEKWFRGDPRRVINLGLDLRGGMHVVLQVLTADLSDEARRDAVPRALEIIRNRVDEFGVAEPSIFPQGRDQIVVQLPGIDDPARALDLIGRTALLEFKLVADDAVARSTLAAINARQPILAHVEEETGRTAEGIPYGYWQIPEKKVRLVEAIVSSDEARALVPDGYEFLIGRPIAAAGRAERVRGLFLVRREAVIQGISLTNARLGRGSMFMPIVNIEFDREGMRRLRIVSGEAERRYRDPKGPVVTRLAIVLDSIVYSAPLMLVKLDASPFIEGRFTVEEANDLAIVLRAGALPAPVEVAENRTVGPSLGRDSIAAGVKAALLGLAIVMVFMAVYYMRAGVIADFALMLNLVIILAAMALFRATLTLPGIAGIILTVGMAVDANVLIFERIREEIALGRKIRAAVTNGYRKAFLTILDANITTLITAIVLFWFGTGPVRGFAVTLSIGILASMFTALFVTRAIFDCMAMRESFTGLRMLRLFGATRIDFIGKLWYALALSAAVICLGAYSFLGRGWDANFGVDFSGGTLQQFGFARPVRLAEMRAALREMGVADAMIQHVENEREIIVKTADDRSREMLALFRERLPDNPVELLRSESVGPVVGRTLRQQAVLAVLFSFGAIILYVWWRFRHARFGIAGVIALVHDVLVTVSFCALAGKQIDLPIVAALLTIVGYSINDTIVIFDRIREDSRLMRKASLREIVNLSINQTLSRTVLTSFTSLVAVACIFIWGGSVIHDFAFALIIGMVSGIYSTVYIAAPILILWPGKGSEI